MKERVSIYKDKIMTASSVGELVDAANRVLFLMKKESEQPITLVCGHLSTGGFDNLEDNIQWIQWATYTTHIHGIRVFDQVSLLRAFRRIAGMGFGDKTQFRVQDIEELYGGIIGSYCISKGLFIPLWSNSVGASTQRRMFGNHNIPVEELPIEWIPLR